MATLKELYEEMEMKALRVSYDLSRHFTRYLCGRITFDEFVQICKEKEAKFEAEMKR